MKYLATIQVILEVDSIPEACDGLAELMRDHLQEYNEASCLVDWGYLSDWRPGDRLDPEDYTGREVTIETENHYGHLFYLRGRIGDLNWQGFFPNGTPCALHYLGVETNQTTRFQIDLSRAKTPVEVLQTLQRYSFNSYTHRLFG